MKVIPGGARADRYKWSVILGPYKRPKINGYLTGVNLTLLFLGAPCHSIYGPTLFPETAWIFGVVCIGQVWGRWNRRDFPKHPRLEMLGVFSWMMIPQIFMNKLGNGWLEITISIHPFKKWLENIGNCTVF